MEVVKREFCREEENPCFPRKVPEVVVKSLAPLLNNPELAALFEQDKKIPSEKADLEVKIEEKVEIEEKISSTGETGVEEEEGVRGEV